MSVSSVDLINSAIYRLLENGDANANVALLTDMFSIDEIVNALDQRQQKWLRDTGMIFSTVKIVASPGNPKYDLPEDNIMVRRVTWSTHS